MNLTQRIETFSALGNILIEALDGKSAQYTLQLKHLIETQHLKNPWFTSENVRMAISAVAAELTTEKLNKWTEFYPDLNKDYPPLRVAVIMAGNIPLVGFHDFLTVLITGNNILAKTSSKDSDLIKFIGSILCDIDSDYRKKINFSDSTISGFDIVIATGILKTTSVNIPA
jgi:Acyl-CoA reductase (LuxC)